MINKVRKTIQKFHMIEPGDRIVLGVSGGPDSVCLLWLLHQLAEEQDFELHVVHVNHLLRKEAEEEETYVRELCAQLQVPCEFFHRNMNDYARELGCSVEEAGRIYRYHCFEVVCKQKHCNKIAVAHHQNDRAETVLFHMTRGTGMKGLAGIPFVRDNVIRPLLQVSRTEIENYLKEHQIRYYLDSSNDSELYSRNRIRNQVLPVLETVNEKAVEHITAVSDLAQEYWAHVEKEAQACEADCIKATETGWEISADVFQNYPELIQKHIIYRVLKRQAGTTKDIEQQHVEQILELLNKQVGKSVSLSYGLMAKRNYTGVEIRKAEDRAEVGMHIPEAVPVILPGTTHLSGIGKVKCEILQIEEMEEKPEISKKLYTKILDYDKIFGTLCIRNPKAGDFFVLNQQSEHKKLSRYFIDHKIPKEKRENIPVLAAENHVYWIIGMRIGDDVKVTEQTNRFLQIEFQYEGEENG